MGEFNDQELSHIIDQWENHDRFRNFDARDEPCEIRLARYTAHLKAGLRKLAADHPHLGEYVAAIIGGTLAYQ
jgi:hypothetical protein